MLWDVTYERTYGKDDRYTGHAHILQVTAESLTHARREALPIIGNRSTILRIDRAYADLPVIDPAKRKVQGT